jgi:pyruvate/2-oxoglutarate dehydrogenase complex dihydrolipoamide acyltransferase (E2) component
MSGTLDAFLPPHLRRRKRLTDIQLGEISLVGMPANPGAMALLHKTAAPQEAVMTAAQESYIQAAAQASVAAVVDKVASHAAAARAALDRMAPASVQKAGQDGATVAAAVQAARSGEDHPPAFWRTALGQLGAQLLPDAPQAAQAQAAMETRDGKALVAALTGDRRLLAT